MGDSLHNHRCWVPKTPAKSASSKSCDQICKYSSDSTISEEVNTGLDKWEAALMRKSIPDATTAKLGDNAMNKSSDSYFTTGFEGTRFEASDATPSDNNKFVSVGPNMWINKNYVPSTPNTDSTPSQDNFDLNTPLKGLLDAVSTGFSSSTFAPITPDQSKKPENSSNQTTDEQISNDSSSAAVSTQIEKTHNLDIDKQKSTQLKPKRRKHRPKVVREGKAKRGSTSAILKPGENKETPKRVRKYVKKDRSDKVQSLPEATPETKETPRAKRKYVRKNGVDKPRENNSEEVASKDSDTKKDTRERKSCKKRLNFEENSSAVEESSYCRATPNAKAESQEIKEKVESEAPNENPESQAQNFQSGVEPKSPLQPCQSSELIYEYTKTDVIQELGFREQGESKKGKCRIVFSDKTHDKDEPIIDTLLNNNSQPVLTLNNSSDSNVTNLHGREDARGLKRGHVEQRSTNMIGGHHNPMSNYIPTYQKNANYSNSVSGTYFSPVEKKQQKQKRNTTASRASSSGTKEADTYNFNNFSNASYGPDTNILYMDGQYYYPSGFNTQNISFSAQLQQQNFEYQLLLKHAKMMTETGCSQVPCYLAEGASTSDVLQVYQGADTSHIRVELKVAKSRKSTEKGNIRKKIAAVRRKKKPNVDDITEYLKHLQIDPEYEHKRALVLYNGVRSLVPFEGLFNPTKKRKERAKVHLDDETSKVWRLLLENINSEGINGTDEEKAKWWENERKVFQGRAESFIARMHLVQGDRRFSPWKGSVVDSVVGVFLTQNVSDHASSSAFMSMAAHFPIKTKESSGPSFKETSVPFKEQKVQNFEPENTLNSSTSNKSKATFMELLRMAESQRKSQNSGSGCISSYTETVQHFMYQSEASTQKIDRGLCNRNAPNGSEENCVSEQSEVTVESPSQDTVQKVSKIIFRKESIPIDAINCNSEDKQVSPTTTNHGSTTSMSVVNSDLKKGNNGKKKEKEIPIDWDVLRLRAEEKGKRERTPNTVDSLDWEAVLRADVGEVAATIKERGMNNVLAGRIQDFLNRLVTEHGSIDLEWLRDVPPDKAKEYLLSVRGLGLKSVECVRLLTLHHLAFPVDTNVGRIAVRLGWVPLQPLPESLQLHLLELYPVMETIQQYLWPRLCKLDQKTLYELHYQMITFGKVFCTKSKPNCNACPMKGECRHFASAFASARLSLPGPEDKRMVNATQNKQSKQTHYETIERLQILETQPSQELLAPLQNLTCDPTVQIPSAPIVEEPIIEEPNSPEPEVQIPESDIEDVFPEDPEEIPMIKLNLEKFTKTLENYLGEGDMSKALVALTQEAASIPMPKLKNVNQLRTEHQVYELPDSHPLLEGMDKREPDDPSSYLLAIWTPGETANSFEQPQSKCSSQVKGDLCEVETCFSCNSIREANSQTVRGTLLIPCRTATRGSFPLNGTYFQVNEVFADHASSLKPIDVPRSWIWNLARRTVYFGTSIPTIFKGLSTESIQYCFWRGFVCVRGFDQKTRAPRPLIARLHFPASRVPKTNAKTDEKKD